MPPALPTARALPMRRTQTPSASTAALNFQIRRTPDSSGLTAALNFQIRRTQTPPASTAAPELPDPPDPDATGTGRSELPDRARRRCDEHRPPAVLVVRPRDQPRAAPEEHMPANPRHQHRYPVAEADEHRDVQRQPRQPRQNPPNRKDPISTTAFDFPARPAIEP